MRGTSGSLGSAFNSLFLGSTISNLGDGLRLAALPLLATELTSSPLLISLVTAAQFLPWVTFGPFGGAFVDRWDRRRTILVTQTWRGLVMAGLGVLVWTDLISIWQIYVVAFAITLGEILVDPSVMAIIPNVVDDDQFDVANGRITGMEIVANEFAGGPMGAAAFAFAPWLPFIVDGLSYLGSNILFRRLPSRGVLTGSAPSIDRPSIESESVIGPAQEPGASQGLKASVASIRSEAREGFQWLRGHPVLGPLAAVTAWFTFGGAAAFSLLVLTVTDLAGGSALDYGVVLAAGAVGALLGSLASARVSLGLGPRLALSLGAAVSGFTLLGMAWADTAFQLALAWFLNGIPIGVWMPIAKSMQQRLTPNHLLGRVNVSARVLTRGSMTVGALASGVLAEATNVRWSFIAAGAIQLTAALMLWVVLGRYPPVTSSA